MTVDSNLLKLLACPRHRTPLFEAGSSLRCREGHQYFVVGDIPVLLDNGPQTLWVAERFLKEAVSPTRGAEEDPYFLDTIAVSESETNHLKKACERSRADSLTRVYLFLSARPTASHIRT